jgi:HTH-type transcriptional regulator / antitoxin MqsA
LGCWLGEVEFEAGEGVRFAEAIKQLAKEVDTKEATELARIRKKLKLTQQQAALLTGGGPNALKMAHKYSLTPVTPVIPLIPKPVGGLFLTIDIAYYSMR